MKNPETLTHHPEMRETKLATVLLVDDDAKLTRGLERYLEDDFRVLTAICPAEANVVVSQEDVDLILSDNLMTGVLGTEFLKTIHAVYPEIKLLMLSGYMPEAAAQRVIAECGVSEVLIKPCDSSVVVNAIRNALVLPAN